VASLRTPNESTSDPWRNHPSLRFENRRGNTLERSFSSAILSDDGTSNVIPFILADIGEGIAEVELLQWFVQEGDQVHQFDRVCEVQSDKATVEITSRYDGLITSLEHKTGGMVKVGSPLLFIESDDEAAVSNLHSTASTQAPPMEDDEKLQIPSIASQYHLSTDDQDEAEQLMASAHLETDTSFSSGGSAGIEEEEAFISRLLTPRPASSTKVLTTPAIRKLAAEYSLDLSTIVGTGPKGRVLKGDVLTVLRERGLTTTTPQQQQNDLSKKATQASSTPERDVSSKNGSTITCIDQAELPLGKDTVMEIRGYNRLMVQSMTASLQIPHMVYADEINVTGLRTQYKSNLPFLPYCIKAASMALSKYPLLNASFDADANQVLLWSDHNIGIAMDTPRGLIVPVVKQVQHKSLVEIASELRRLKEFAKDGSVPAEDLQGATFTLSNIGAIGGGGTYMSPIVTSPQVAIGALGQVQRVPRFVSENSTEVYEAHIVNVSWGGDHRVVDGATMARFHTQWKEYLQDPISLIQEMK
jgi:2-oxoisovalerate dehydrogenase E2 component (dihydrolipoyl transacylase)